MFSGIVSDIGVIRKCQSGAQSRFDLATSYALRDLPLGASICVHGLCLTVQARGRTGAQNWFRVDVSSETRARSTAARWQIGTRVHLERSLALGDTLDGHFVFGHVDGVARITKIVDEAAYRRIRLRPPKALMPMIAQKGSVALNGTSLTINHHTAREFDIMLVPHTLAVTCWGDAKIGDDINLEVDMLARYVARLLDAKGAVS